MSLDCVGPYLALLTPFIAPLQQAAKFPGESPTEGLRRIRVSGSDIVYRYMLEASTCAHVSSEQYRQFDRLNPQSLPCPYYILQNVYMTARSMDESSVHYLLEANSVSEQMRSIFIALCDVASVVPPARAPLSRMVQRSRLRPPSSRRRRDSTNASPR